MKFDINLNIRGLEGLLPRAIFEQLTHLERKIMATQKELLEGLKAVNAQVTKIGTETSGLSQKVATLQAALDAAGGTTPEVDEAMNEVRNSLQAVDDLVVDLPAVPDVPGTTEEEPPTP